MYKNLQKCLKGDIDYLNITNNSLLQRTEIVYVKIVEQ